MPPSTSTRENALANVVTTLEAVETGSTYNFTIDKVARTDGPFFIWLDDSYQTLAFVEEGLTSWKDITHGGLHMATVEVFVQMATQYQPDHDGHPFLMSTDPKSTFRSKLIGDAVRALMADRQRGGYARYGFILTDDAPINLDEIDTEGVWRAAGWVAHELRFEMSIQVDEDSP